MILQPSTEGHPALQLLRSGRFADAAVALERSQTGHRAGRRLDIFEQALLADALQRVGRNEDAREIALRNLQRARQSPQIAARYHFVLGNINRERGYVTQAIEHLQVATSLAGADLELVC